LRPGRAELGIEAKSPVHHLPRDLQRKDVVAIEGGGYNKIKVLKTKQGKSRQQASEAPVNGVVVTLDIAFHGYSIPFESSRIFLAFSWTVTNNQSRWSICGFGRIRSKEIIRNGITEHRSIFRIADIFGCVSACGIVGWWLWGLPVANSFCKPD
jgi:hypothetical protein